MLQHIYSTCCSYSLFPFFPLYQCKPTSADYSGNTHLCIQFANLTYGVLFKRDPLCFSFFLSLTSLGDTLLCRLWSHVIYACMHAVQCAKLSNRSRCTSLSQWTMRTGIQKQQMDLHLQSMISIRGPNTVISDLQLWLWAHTASPICFSNMVCMRAANQKEVDFKGRGLFGLH